MRKKQLFHFLGYWAAGCATVAALLGLAFLMYATVWGTALLAFLVFGGVFGFLIWRWRQL